MYITLKPDNIIYFIRELEFRYNIRNKQFDAKLKELQEILEYCYITCNYNFYDKDFLTDENKDLYS